MCVSESRRRAKSKRGPQWELRKLKPTVKKTAAVGSVGSRADIMTVFLKHYTTWLRNYSCVCEAIGRLKCMSEIRVSWHQEVPREIPLRRNEHSRYPPVRTNGET
jgi:hypothetical protein